MFAEAGVSINLMHRRCSSRLQNTTPLILYHIFEQDKYLEENIEIKKGLTDLDEWENHQIR